jgi:hypothetical protein
MVSAVSAGTTLLTAFLLKLLFGSDDALLLTTYFVRPGATKTYQAKMAAIYVLMMNLIVCLAVRDRLHSDPRRRDRKRSAPEKAKLGLAGGSSASPSAQGTAGSGLASRASTKES